MRRHHGSETAGRVARLSRRGGDAAREPSPALVPLRGADANKLWRSLYMWLLAPMFVAIAGGAAGAQRAGTQGAAPGASAGALEAMTGDLRRLVSANEVYRAKNKRYAADVSALTGYAPSRGVTVTLVSATATGWGAKAVTADLPGKSCVVAVGTVVAPPKTDATGRTAPDAVVVCDPA